MRMYMHVSVHVRMFEIAALEAVCFVYELRILWMHAHVCACICMYMHVYACVCACERACPHFLISMCEITTFQTVCAVAVLDIVRVCISYKYVC